MAYFDDLVPDYTVELPVASKESIETIRRIMYMFKLAINGKMIAIADEDGVAIGLSPEFIDNFQWTLEEFQALEPTDFFHEKSINVATTHQENHLAAPYIARCYKKNGNLSYYEIQGLCVDFENQHWRMLAFEKL